MTKAETRQALIRVPLDAFVQCSPFYRDDTTTLYHGDAREILPLFTGMVDGVITDPPYGETSLEWDRWPDGWPGLLLGLTKSLWCFGSLRMFMEKAHEFKGWKLSQDVIWEKHNGTNPFNDRFRRLHEQPAHFYPADTPWSEVYKNPLYTNDATARTVRRKKRPPQWGDIGEAHYRSEDGGPRLMGSVIFAKSCHGYAIHPTQKPEAIITPLLQYAIPPGGTVLDIFAGSGTTGAVARTEGRKAILIEKGRDNCEKIADRLRAILC